MQKTSKKSVEKNEKIQSIKRNLSKTKKNKTSENSKTILQDMRKT